MPTRHRTLQQTLRSLHLWLGLMGGTLIVMMGLTGMIAVFRPLVENSIAPSVHSTGSPSSLAAVERGFAAVHPGARILRVTIPEQNEGLMLVQADTTSNPRFEAYFDAASGRELGPHQTIGLLEWIVDLHQNLLLGKTGRRLTGIIGFALLFSAVSGLLAWLNGPREWKRGLALPASGPWRRTNYELHRWAGLWANLFMMAVSVTGIVLAYPDSFQQAVRLVTREQPPKRGERKIKIKRETAADGLPLDAYVRAAVTAVPGGVVRELRMPGRPNGTVSVYLWAPGDIRPKGGNVVLLHPASASVLSVTRSTEAPFPEKLVELANAIHKTELGGFAWKLAWSLLGLLPLLFFVSGFQIWRARRESLVRLNQSRKEGKTELAATVNRPAR
ncbi:MAG TPA: PepSY-associated TM helix domain-containing protein [Bryobacteraceae bacterium]|nr:PepSY-associated TM helix domain-containing protein [Bryobacteraceae bacterium]